MKLTPGTKLGPYEILALIGAGGMGEVYRAHDSRVGRDVAIKVSTEQFSERFEREIRAVASLNHSNICTLYDVGPDYLVMELVEGPTLADRIKQGAIPLEESLEIVRQIADSLEAAHEKGIVHRDLKPANIKIKPDGTVKVLDFGLAKVGGTPVVSSDNSPTLSVAQTATGVILGTAAYMSPEQAKGKSVDKRADIWAFGVVLYEMLIGKQLFSGETVSDILAAVLMREPQWDLVPAKARRLLRTCLQKDPKKRLADISDAKLIFEDAPESAPAKRPWLAWSVAALAVLIAVALAFVHFRDKAPIAAEPVRFQIAFPDKVVPAGSEPFALSPDGRRLAFAGRGSDGVARLWIRSLDSLEVRPLLGSELNSSSVGFCFWSPDSRFIAFDAGGQLKKIDLSGGQPQILCDLSGSAIGGSWNREGTIILGNSTGGLLRVSDNGGDPTPLTRLDQSRQEHEHVLPSFLPDGRHFVYFRNSVIPENAGVYVGSLDARPEEQGGKRLVKTSRAAVYVPSQFSSIGHLLFLREGTLLAQAFDDRRLELTGEPVAVAEQVSFFRAGGFFSVSTNGILAYRSGGAWQVHNQQATWFDRQGKVLGTAGEVGAQSGLALSPDGARAAFSSSQRNTFDLWLLDFARGINMRFTFGQGDSRDPIWSPDGSRIVFASNRDGALNLYQRMTSGIKNDELLLKSSEDKSPTSWSSDGRFLLYTVIDHKTKRELWILPLEGERTPIPFLRTEFNEFDGHFSPDMRWIAYTSDESGSNEIYVRGFSRSSGGASSETGGKLLVSKGGGSGARWRWDKELYYRAPDGTVMALEVTAGTVFQAGTPKPLFLAQFTQAPLPGWDITADGKRFLISIPSGGGGTPTPFTVVLNWTALVKK